MWLADTAKYAVPHGFQYRTYARQAWVRLQDLNDVRTAIGCGRGRGADHAVYGGTGFDEIRDQTLDPSSYTIGDQVEQTAVVFPSADAAQSLLAAQTKQWQECVNLPSSVPGTPGLQMGQRHGEGGLAWTLANLVTTSGLITLKMAGYDNEAGSHQACQQALGVHANVVVKIRACREMIATTTNSPTFTDTSAAGDYAERLANAMVAKIIAPAPSPAASPATSVPSTSVLPAGGASGLPCNASNAAKLAYDSSNGAEIVCVNQALTANSASSWQWAQPPPMTTGVNATGTSCDPQAEQIMSRSPDGYLVVCHADDRGDHTVGYWQHFLGPLE
jgi:hypothetical protein